MKTYNGWTNYATWRVNLELLDDVETSLETSPEDYTEYVENGEISDDNRMEIIYNLSKELESYVEEVMDSYDTDSIVRSYADSFLSDVNYYEIAEHKYDSTINEIIEKAAEEA